MIGFARPYTTDFFGWFDDFSTTGGFFDANGAIGRGQFNFAENLPPTMAAPPEDQPVQALPGLAPTCPPPTGPTCSARPSRTRSAAASADRAVR